MPTLITKLSLDGTGFQRGLDNAMGRVRKFGSAVAGALKGPLAGAFSVAAVAAFGRSIIKAASNIKDLADRLELSTDMVQKLELAGMASGTSIDQISTYVTKLYEGLQSGSKQVTEGLRAIGLTAEDFVGKSFAEAFAIIQARLLGMTNSAVQAEASFNLFSTRGGLRMLQVLREMENIKTPPLFDADTLARIDAFEEKAGRLFRKMQINAYDLAESFVYLGLTLKDMLTTSNEEYEKVYKARRASFFKGNQQAPGGPLNLDGSGEKAANRDADKLGAIMERIAERKEDNEFNLLKTDQQKREMLEKRRDAALGIAESPAFDVTQEAKERRANARLRVADLDADLIRLANGADKGKDRHSITSANELASIGGRASIGGGGVTSPVLAELKKIHDALSRNGIVLRKF